MKKTLFVLLLLTTINAVAQTSFIKQSKAFYYIRIPGNIPVDEKQNPIQRPDDTIMTIYLEVKGKVPHLETAWINGQSFNLVPTIVKANTVKAGKKPDSDEDVTFKISKGNSLVSLEFTEGKQLPKPQKTGKNEILIQGTQNKKKFYYKVKKIIQVSSPEFM